MSSRRKSQLPCLLQEVLFCPKQCEARSRPNTSGAQPPRPFLPWGLGPRALSWARCSTTASTARACCRRHLASLLSERERARNLQGPPYAAGGTSPTGLSPTPAGACPPPSATLVRCDGPNGTTGNH